MMGDEVTTVVKSVVDQLFAGLTPIMWYASMLLIGSSRARDKNVITLRSVRWGWVKVVAGAGGVNTYIILLLYVLACVKSYNIFDITRDYQ